jgi:PhnB protein
MMQRKDVFMISRKSPLIYAYICCDGAAEAIDFYKRAFGAEERCRMPVSEGGPLGHAAVAIGDTVLFLADEYPQNGWLSPKRANGVTPSIVLAVDDCDAWLRRAVDAGATAEREITDGHDGRYGIVVDPYGHRWHIMTPNAQFGQQHTH